MLKNFGTLVILLALALLMTPAVTFAQQPDQPQKSEQKVAQGGTTTLSSQDRDFILKIAEANHKEIMMAEMAVNKASNSEVKEYAQRLVNDHTKAIEELKALASSKGVTLPADHGTKHQKMKADMEKHSGAAFDREFMGDMLKGHRKSIETFERQSRQGRDSELKAWVDKTLPTLREHHQQARDIAPKVGVMGVDKGQKGTTGTKPQQ